MLIGMTLLFSFLARPTVSVSGPTVPDDAFSSKFTVSPDNFLPLEDVDVGVAPSLMDVGNGTTLQEYAPLSDKSPALYRDFSEHHELHMDDQLSFTLKKMFEGAVVFRPGAKLQRADIGIMVKYKPWFLPFNKSKAFRFVTQRRADGNLYWRTAEIQ